MHHRVSVPRPVFVCSRNPRSVAGIGGRAFRPLESGITLAMTQRPGCMFEPVTAMVTSVAFYAQYYRTWQALRHTSNT